MSTRVADNRSFTAGADLTGKKYHIVKQDSTGKLVSLASAAADKSVGVLDNAPKLGDTADVALRSGSGTCKVVLGGTVAVGDELTSDANGAAVATTTAGNQVVGVALFPGVAGDVVEIMPALRQV